MSDSEQCSNRLEVDLISLLVNFSCELGQIMTRYDFLWARWVILSNVWTDLNLIFDQLGQLCMCIGVNNLGGSFEKSPNVVLTKIQNFIEIQSSRFRWYSFVFARTQSRLVHILFLFASYPMICWPKLKLGQVGAASNIAQNNSSSLDEVRFDHFIVCPISHGKLTLSKVGVGSNI